MRLLKQSRDISGGGKVDIYDPSADGRLSFAFVTMDKQQYPEKGSGVNQDQIEGIFIVSGEFTITYDHKAYDVKKGDVFYFEEGFPYEITGTGTAVVAITPGIGGTTNIVA